MKKVAAGISDTGCAELAVCMDAVGRLQRAHLTSLWEGILGEDGIVVCIPRGGHKDNLCGVVQAVLAQRR